MAVTTNALRTQFFEYVFGIEIGYVCIATQKPNDKTTFKQAFFQWPQQKAELSAFVAQASTKQNVWFCINLLSKAERKKINCKPSNIVWADLDTCKPHEIEPKPQCIIQSSPGRYQGIWRLDTVIDPDQAEFFSKKIAYTFVQNGADPSGWDLTQLLRVPFTRNFKYIDGISAPEVFLEEASEVLIPVGIMEEMPVPSLPASEADIDVVDMPDIAALPDPQFVIYKYLPSLRGTTFAALYDTTPTEGADWSQLLWKMINMGFEAGMDAQEIFTLALNAKCNKYIRDNRPIGYLWREVCKAEALQNRILKINETYVPLAMPQLVTKEELKAIPPNIIDEYREWAVNATDAVPQFHDLSCFILLSTLMASGLYCNVSYGKTIPNIWGLILGDSTLTRKTTAMRMAMDFVAEIDRDLVLATDGSAEGLLSGLSNRPNRVSVYFKDEVSGFLDSISRKDYLAGMPETMTQLYDVPEFYTRRLRKETISIVSPVFIFFGGGIRDKMYELISEDYILSGFLPRFLVVSGDADLKTLKRTGPATVAGADKREALRDKFANLYEQYNRVEQVMIAGQPTTLNARVEVVLTDDAWKRYGDIEELLVNTAHSSAVPGLALPTFERMSRSMLKMAMLIAATRSHPEDTNNVIACGEEDIISAARYIQDWGRYSVDLLINSGKSVTQRTIDKVIRMVERNPGVTRSEIMRTHHFTKRSMDEILSTLDDRMDIKLTKEGRGVRVWPNK